MAAESSLPPFPFDVLPIQRRIAELVVHTPPRGKYCALNAMRHLCKAHKLLAVDAEMFTLRLITAEEEAAAAVFNAVRRRCYEGAKRLGLRSHLHKLSLMPFLRAVEPVFASFSEKGFAIQLTVDASHDPPRLQTLVSSAAPNAELPSVAPIPPLNFNLTIDGQPARFRRQLEALREHRKVTELMTYLEERESLRTKLLYAEDQGWAVAKGDLAAAFEAGKRDVFVLLAVFLLVDPHPVQPFVQDCLDAFVTMLGMVVLTSEEDMRYHLPRCKHLPASNAIQEVTTAEALRGGRRPCPECKAPAQ